MIFIFSDVKLHHLTLLQNIRTSPVANNHFTEDMDPQLQCS